MDTIDYTYSTIQGILNNSGPASTSRRPFKRHKAFCNARSALSGITHFSFSGARLSGCFWCRFRSECRFERLQQPRQRLPIRCFRRPERNQQPIAPARRDLPADHLTPIPVEEVRLLLAAAPQFVTLCGNPCSQSAQRIDHRFLCCFGRVSSFGDHLARQIGDQRGLESGTGPACVQGSIQAGGVRCWNRFRHWQCWRQQRPGADPGRQISGWQRFRTGFSGCPRLCAGLRSGF